MISKKDKKTALEAIAGMVAMFDLAKDKSQSNMLGTPHGNASLQVLRAIEDWQRAIEAIEESG